MAGSFDNPLSVPPLDLTPLVTAVREGTAASVAAVQQASDRANPRLDNIPEFEYAAVAWTGDASKHIAVAIDKISRIGGTIYNKGQIRVYVDRFMDITKKSNAPQYDGFIEPGGRYNLSATDVSAGVLLYTLAGQANGYCAISLEQKA